MNDKSITEFVERPVTKRATSNRKLKCGIGVNDANYIISNMKDGKLILCPFYKTWSDMLKRCYDEKFKINMPTYVGCTVAEEWHSFMNFKRWMEKQDWEGKDLDKDVLIIGNKIYSSETCVFVSPSVNGLLTHIRKNKGKWPIGVSFDKKTNKYLAQCSISGKNKKLGYFATPEEAGEVYKKTKRKEILRQANIQIDDRIRQGLIRHAEAL